MTTHAPPHLVDVEATIPHLRAWLLDTKYQHPEWVIAYLNTVDINTRNTALRNLSKRAPQLEKKLRLAASVCRRKKRNGTYQRTQRRDTSLTPPRQRKEHDRRCNAIRSHYTTASTPGLIFIHEATQ